MATKPPQEEPALDKNNPDSIYNWLRFKVSSPSFRNIIKDFIDDNCISFVDVDENSFQQGQLFNEFNQLLENLLSDLLIEGCITQEQFLVAAERGLSDDKYKKYFEQILNFSDYTYFKKVMTKRNYQLIKRVEEQMDQQKKEEQKKKEEELKKQAEMENQKNKTITGKEKEEEENRKLLNQLLYKEEEEELQRAIQQSIQMEEEKKKIAIIEDEELQRALKRSLVDAVRAPPENNEEKKKEKEIKQEPKKEEKPIEPKKQEFKIEKNNMFNFSEEKPITSVNTPLTKNEFESKEEKPFKPSYIISASKGTEFQIEGKKAEFGISNTNQNKKTEFEIEKRKNDFEISAPKIPNPYTRPAPTPAQPKQTVKIENSHVTEELIDDTPEIKKEEKKDYKPTLIEIEKKKAEIKEKKNIIIENKDDNKKENKKSFNLLQFEENPKEENIVMAKEIKREKASDIIKNSLNQNKIDDENDDGGLLIDEDEGEDINNIQNAPKTNTFIDKKKDINLGKIKLGKDGGNFLNNFGGVKNYEKGGINKMENIMKGEQHKSVLNNQDYDEDYLDKIKEVENEKQARLKEYMEQLLKMKKEKRENKAKEVLSPEELAKLESKKKLAEKLKAKRK